MLYNLIQGSKRCHGYKNVSNYLPILKTIASVPNLDGRAAFKVLIKGSKVQFDCQKRYGTELVSNYVREDDSGSSFKATRSSEVCALPISPPEPRVLLEVSHLICDEKYELAVEALLKVIKERGGVDSKPYILELIDKFLTSQIEPGGSVSTKRLKLLFEKEIYRPEQCPADELRQALMVQLIVKGCDLQTFKFWEDFGRPFRNLVQQIARDIPPFQGTMLIRSILGQVSLIYRSAAHNAVVESIYGEVSSSYRMFGASLVRRMLDLELRPSGRCYELAMVYYASFPCKTAKENLRYLKSSKRLYYRMRPLKLNLPFKTQSKVLNLFIHKSKNNMSNCIHIIDLAFDLVERRWPLSASISQALLSRLEPVEFKQKLAPETRIDGQVKAIFRRLVSVDGISDEKLFSVLLACCSHVGSIATKMHLYPDTFLQLLKEMGIVPNKRHYEAIFSFLGASGDFGGVEALLYRMLNLAIYPDSKTLSSIVNASIVGQAPDRGMMIAHSLLGQGEVASFYRFPTIIPCAELYSLLTAAASLNLELDLALKYFDRYLEASEGAEADCCLRVIKAFHIYLNYTNLPKSIKVTALGCIDKLTNYLNPTYHLGSLTTIYDELISAQAEFLLTSPTANDPECHMPMLNLYRQHFLCHRQHTSSRVYSKMLLALLNCLSQNPSSKDSIVSGAHLLYTGMLEHKLELTCQVFARLISIAGLAENTTLLDSYFQSFLIHYKDEPRPDPNEITQVLHAYGEVFPITPNNSGQLVNIASQFGMGPANCMRKLMIERLIFQDAPPKVIWELLSDLEAHFITSASFSPAAQVRFSFPSIELIASYFLIAEGPQSMIKAVNTFERIGEIPAMPPHCATQLYTRLIKSVVDPHPFMQEDPIPLVAEFLSRLVAVPTNPTMRKEYFSTLWRLSDQVTPRANPWLVWLKLRRMLARAEDTTQPPPSPKDLLALP